MIDPHLYQDFSAGQHTVLIRKSLTQMVKDGRAFPENKEIKIK